ncbi:uncharacterized protein LOC111105942 [Crassostrea virginica]
MNELRVRNLLLDRYNTKFFSLVHKISRPFTGTPCYSNNLACHPAAGDMRSALKIKIHNAINSAILADSEDRGIFVGGRRRNRKKKRTKHVKTEKKKSKRPQGAKESTDMRNNLKDTADQQQQLFEADTKPLIESGFCDSIVSFGEFIDLDPDLEEDGEEDIPPLVESGITLGPLVKYSYAVPNIVEYIQQIDTETDNMPFFKKKPSLKEETEQLQEKQQQEEIKETINDVITEPETKNSDGDEVKKENVVTSENPEMTPEVVDRGTSSPAEDGGRGTAVEDEAKVETTQGKEGEGGNQPNGTDGVKIQYQDDIDGVVIETDEKNTAVVTEQPIGQVQLNSKESSPLINKEEGAPCLCCTIL